MIRPLTFTLLALALPTLVAAGARAQTQTQTEDAIAAAPAAPSTRLLGVDVEGSKDPPGRIEALLSTVPGPGGAFVPSGDADRVGMPIGTIPRIKHVLEVIG